MTIEEYRQAIEKELRDHTDFFQVIELGDRLTGLPEGTGYHALDEPIETAYKSGLNPEAAAVCIFLGMMEAFRNILLNGNPNGSNRIN